MRSSIRLAWFLGVTLGCFAAPAAEPHRVVVVSATDDRRSSDPCEIRLIEIETARVLAQVEVGDTADAVLSPRGDVLTVVSQHSVAGTAEPRKRLELYQTSDLSLVKRGYVPVPSNIYQRVPHTVRAQYSPDATEIVVQQMVAHDAVLTRVSLELNEEGAYQIVGQPLKIVGARGVTFLRTDWPQLTVWGHVDGLIHVLDLDKSSQVSQVTLDPLADVPAELPRRHGTGQVVTSDGKYGYYVPQQYGRPSAARHVGHLERIDLRATPPKVIDFSEQPQPNLRAQVATVSETAGILVVAEQKYSATGPFLAPSSHLKFFHTRPLTPAREIDVSLSNCDSLATSRDGKYLYAVDFAGGMSVVEISTGKEIQTLQDVGAHPGLVLPLP